MRCGWAVKGEGKKRKFGECVRARDRGESFTRSVHARRAKRGRFSIYRGRNARKWAVVFVLPRVLLSFDRSVISWRWGVGRNRRARWEWVCALVHGMRVQRVQRGEEKNTARNASQWRCALSRCSSFVFMLSLDSGANAPVFSFEL